MAELDTNAARSSDPPGLEGASPPAAAAPAEPPVEPPAGSTDLARATASRPRWKRWLWRALQVFLGLFLGLVLTAVIFWWRDDGAFPHVNLYVPDAELGVRLEPGASQRFQLRDNPITDIRINSEGYRGADFPEKTVGQEILVVGDSQVFGLGVEESETFSARLAEITGTTVINGGVPTYGPMEYTAVARELMAERKPKTVVYVVNFVNDLFETNRPNRDRHAVWDGWAVRSETAPTSVTHFPGRKWLFSKSHAFYALRRWLQKDEKLDAQGFASEGVWQDLVSAGTEVASTHEQTEREVAERNQQRTAAYRDTLAKMWEAGNQAEELTIETVPELEPYDDSIEVLRLRAAGGSPGDIVGEEAAEEGRNILATAKLIRQGVRYRYRLERKLAKKPKKHKKALAAIEARRQLERKSVELYSHDIETAYVPSVLEPRIREIKAACDAAGADLVVVALPIDVQVSSDEWKKYGVEEPIDMAPSRVLLSDLVHTVEQMGVRAIDVTPALAAVTAPAFLDHDIHMTPAGHLAVAEALAKKLQEPAPLPVPELTLPAGRTRPPPPHAWKSRLEIGVGNSTPAFCETKLVGEWFRASCLPKNRRHIPSGIEVTRGGHGEAMTVVTNSAATLVTPLFPGDEFTATFHWTRHSRVLTASWPEGAKRPTIDFGPPIGSGKPLEVSDDDGKLCQCYVKETRERECPVDEYENLAYEPYDFDDESVQCKPSCAGLYGAATAECLATYGDDCKQLLACARGAPDALPECPDGHANAGGNGQCAPLCSDEQPCASGTCTPWQGARICR